VGTDDGKQTTNTHNAYRYLLSIIFIFFVCCIFLFVCLLGWFGLLLLRISAFSFKLNPQDTSKRMLAANQGQVKETFDFDFQTLYSTFSF